MDKKSKLLKLFVSTFFLSASTFGGGYVIVSLMKKKFVDEYKWIQEEEMLDLIAIAQSAPGAIAVNGAIVMGYKIAGIIGMLVAILATVIPPFLIICIVSVFYTLFQSNIYVKAVLEGMQSGVAAIIAAVVYEMGSGIVKTGDIISIGIMILAFLANYFLKISAVYIVLICILIGVIRTIVTVRRQR